jgi:cytochrome c oxidase assembly protein subunit 15
VALNIVTGGAVRLSDSGLGCPDWPTCFRHRLTPPMSFHPSVEFGNRMVVVALCIAAAVTLAAALRLVMPRRDQVWLAAGLIGGVVAEAVLGGIVVYTKLNPYVVMTHFVVGMALLSVATVLALRAGRSHGPAVAASGDTPRAGRGALKVDRSTYLLSRVVLVGLAVAVAAGTATTGAGPHAGGRGAKRLPVALADMARLHSSIVLVVAALTVVLLCLLARQGALGAVQDRGRVLLVVMVAQGVIGYTQYFSHLPALLVGLHILGASMVWVTMLWFHDGLRHRGSEVAARGPSPAPTCGEPEGARETAVNVPDGVPTPAS